MAWRFEILPSAEDDLAALDRPVRKQILDRLDWLSEHFEDVISTQLKGVWKGLFKLRAGDWRIAYTFDTSTKIVRIHVIEHRSKIYKRRK